MSGFYFFQSRAKVQLLCVSLIVLSIVLLLVHQTRNAYYYEPLDKVEKFQQLAKEERRLSHQTGNVYNLMDEAEGSRKTDSALSNAECTLGNDCGFICIWV